MLKIFFVSIVILLLNLPSLNAQVLLEEDDYDVSSRKLEKQPWYGNNAYLYNFMANCGYFEEKEGYEKALYRIPVKFWVYCRKDGTGNATPEEIKQYINDLNSLNILNNTGFFYYLSEIKYVRRPCHIKMGYYFEAFTLTMIRHTAGCINVHVANKFVKTKLFKPNTGVRGTYNSITKSVYLKRENTTSSLSHELGHYFGLAHTHQDWNKGKKKQEAVSRTREFEGGLKKGLICEKNGDGICDTPAEPNLKYYTNKDCVYYGDAKYMFSNLTIKRLLSDSLPEDIADTLSSMTYIPYYELGEFEKAVQNLISKEDYENYREKILKRATRTIFQMDNWGDLYKPHTNNIMSYARNRECRDNFTLGQIAVMLHTAKKKDVKGWDAKYFKEGTTYKHQYYFDAYEPDNIMSMAGEIKPGQTQKHTFNKLYKNKRKDIDEDIDWLKLNVEKEGEFIEIRTGKGDFKEADTELFLYDESGNLISSDNNGSNGNFSKIKVSGLKQGIYYIKVQKLNFIPNPDIADYSITVKEEEN